MNGSPVKLQTQMASISMLAILFLLPLFLLLLRIKLVLSKQTRLPPSPLKLPLIGNLHQLGSVPHRSLRDLAEKHGPLMLLRLGQIPTLIVSSPEMAREILSTHDHIFASRPSLKAAKVMLYDCHDIGFAPYGGHWRQLRKICVTHLLSSRRVQSYRAATEDEVLHLMEKISRASSSLKQVNMSETGNFFAADMLCRLMLGKVSQEENRNKLFREIIRENVAVFSSFHVEDYFPSLGWLSPLFGLDERAKENAKKWDTVLDKMIKEHANRKEEKQEVDLDFVDVMLSLQKDRNMNYSLTNDHIKALLLDMFSGGIDTSSIVLEWAMAELIKNQEVMKKLQDEVRGIGGGNSMINDEDLSAMSYLKAILKEVLRLHPPAPLLVPRESMESCQIQGYEIPKQTRVLINYWAIGRDPRFWEAPLEFRPERFLDSSIDFKGHDFQYTPFGSGRRICPGMQLATSTIELVLANLVNRFDWSLPDGMAEEDLDMSEAPGLTTSRKESLYLVPKRRF